MKKPLTFSLLAFFCLFVSCKDEGYYERFDGYYSGSYLGDEIGFWTMKISSNSIMGSIKADTFAAFPVNFTGRAEDGVINQRIPLESDTFVMNGSISGNSVSGSWYYYKSTAKGTFKGQKDDSINHD